MNDDDDDGAHKQVNVLIPFSFFLCSAAPEELKSDIIKPVTAAKVMNWIIQLTVLAGNIFVLMLNTDMTCLFINFSLLGSSPQMPRLQTILG